MYRLALLLVPAVLAVATGRVAAQPLAPPAPAAKEAPDPLADLIIPPAHGAPKQLITGATRGIAVPGRPNARTVIGLEPMTPGPAAPTNSVIAPRQ